MTEARHCTECGADLSSAASPGGLCPKCLLRLAFPESLESAEDDVAQPDADDLRPTERLDAVAPTPDRVGNYRLLRKLGEGGMGEVYEAEQERPVRRKVALKLIKPGMDTRQVVARFESERQALALMSHPNIARVFDAGATEKERPYFVMEYVPGVPITTYCDKHRLTTTERLELFTEVCAGVQHAHQKGVIHRDIKPSNVLVAIEDDRPAPKIIDFGVAKATQQRLTERTMFTAMGALVGTPEYMSPEQAEPTALDVDTRTDVYSLGVLLYELLVGALPFDPAELRRAGFDEICRRIREDEPSRPSTRVGTLGDAATESATQRSTDPRSLRRDLRGDLDWITMKALEKDRVRRYGSPSDLAADVLRHLRHEPVLAGPPGAAYRAGKFVRRHRVSVGFSAILLLLLVGFAVSMAIQANRIARERDRANQEAETAQQVSEFLVDLFGESHPNETRGRVITAREVLDKGAEKIETELEDQPVVKARAMNMISRVYKQLGLFEPAERLGHQALSIQRSVLGVDDAETLTTMTTLGQLRLKQGRYAEAERVFRDALDGRRRVLGPEHPDTLASMGHLANLLRIRGRYEEAEPLFIEALETRRRVVGVDRLTVACMGNLAALYIVQGRHDEAEPLLVEVLEGQRQLMGDDHPDTLVGMTLLGEVYVIQGRYPEAERMLIDSAEMQERVLGAEHPTTQFPRHVLAGLYRRQGRHAEAEEILLEVLEVRRRGLGDGHPHTLHAMGDLARLRALTGRCDDALGLLSQAVELGYTRAGEPENLREDPDFTCLHDHPDFEILLARMREQAGAPQPGTSNRVGLERSSYGGEAP